MRVLGSGFLGVAAVSAVLVIVACDEGKDVQHSLMCSEGPAQYSVAHYPEARTASTTQNLPECLPICGAQKISSPPFVAEYALEALPSGTCEFDKDHCQITAGVTQTCPGTATRTCDQSAFECFCEGDQWRCYSTSQGSDVCPPCSDAGP